MTNNVHVCCVLNDNNCVDMSRLLGRVADMIRVTTSPACPHVLGWKTEKSFGRLVVVS
jgi:hypothetical protein